MDSEPVFRLRQSFGIGYRTPVTKGPRTPQEEWPEVAAPAKQEGRRAIARELDVSYETVRRFLTRVTLGRFQL
jgi:DNA invertase Pin-like site-specific DNA recombinase